MRPHHYIVAAITACASTLLAADIPTQAQGANALNAKITRESNGLLRLVKFEKTNGQSQQIFGVQAYEMMCLVEVVATDDCGLTGFTFGQWEGSFGALKSQKSDDVFNPSSAAYGMYKRLKKGEHMFFKPILSFELTEKGWMVDGSIPPNTPFVPEAPYHSQPPRHNRPPSPPVVTPLHPIPRWFPWQPSARKARWATFATVLNAQATTMKKDSWTS